VRGLLRGFLGRARRRIKKWCRRRVCNVPIADIAQMAATPSQALPAAEDSVASASSRKQAIGSITQPLRPIRLITLNHEERISFAVALRPPRPRSMALNCSRILNRHLVNVGFASKVAHPLSACSSGGLLREPGRPAIRDTRVTCAIGYSVHCGVTAESEVDSTDAADGPATFARR
jgi:hypothetical protein